MMPGLGGFDPKKMQALMKQMGIKQEEIDSLRVIIEKTDNSKIVINNPSVLKINMQGQESWQITGDAKEIEGERFSQEDIKTIIDRTGCTKTEAQKALEETGDIAEAIIKLSD